MPMGFKNSSSRISPGWECDFQEASFTSNKLNQLMIIFNGNLVCAAVFPAKYNPPLIVDANAAKT
jgi:hypothetical protein